MHCTQKPIHLVYKAATHRVLVFVCISACLRLSPCQLIQSYCRLDTQTQLLVFLWGISLTNTHTVQELWYFPLTFFSHTQTETIPLSLSLSHTHTITFTVQTRAGRRLAAQHSPSALCKLQINQCWACMCACQWGKLGDSERENLCHPSLPLVFWREKKGKREFISVVSHRGEGLNFVSLVKQKIKHLCCRYFSGDPPYQNRQTLNQANHPSSLVMRLIKPYSFLLCLHVKFTLFSSAFGHHFWFYLIIASLLSFQISSLPVLMCFLLLWLLSHSVLWKT